MTKGRKYFMPAAMLLLLLVFTYSVSAQESREYIRKGNKLYKKSEFAGSEGMYRRAQGQEKATPDADFNLGDALYKQGKYGEASNEYEKSVSTYTDRIKQAESYYNKGNAHLKDNKYKESIDAYINSLKLVPDNMQAKYNLAYAQDQLKKQEEQQKQQQDQNKDDQQKQQDKADQNKENKNDQNQQDQQNQNDQQQQQDQQEQGTMSREDAKRLLDALAAYEKQTQEKVQRDKAAKAKVRVIKNW